MQEGGAKIDVTQDPIGDKIPCRITFVAFVLKETTDKVPSEISVQKSKISRDYGRIPLCIWFSEMNYIIISGAEKTNLVDQILNKTIFKIYNNNKKQFGSRDNKLSYGQQGKIC